MRTPLFVFRILRALTMLLLAGAFALAWSKSAEEYFHTAANLYVQGRLQEAGNEVEQGIKEHPADPKLAGLNSLLKQLKDQQRKDQNQQGGGQNPNPDSQKNQDKNKDQDGKSGQQPKPSPSDSSQNKDNKDKKNGQEQKPDPKKEAQDSTQGGGKKPDENDKTPRDSSQGGEAQKPKPGQMNKDDAERLLNSFENDEKQSQHDRQAPKRQVDVEEDW